MAENIVINNSTPNNSSDPGLLRSLIRPIVLLITVITIIALIFGLVLLVENWEAVGVFFTTGFIGWLNPFDSPEGDTGPVETALNTGAGKTATDAAGGIPIIGPLIQGLGYVLRR